MVWAKRRPALVQGKRRCQAASAAIIPATRAGVNPLPIQFSQRAESSAADSRITASRMLGYRNLPSSSRLAPHIGAPWISSTRSARFARNRRRRPRMEWLSSSREPSLPEPQPLLRKPTAFVTTNIPDRARRDRSLRGPSMLEAPPRPASHRRPPIRTVTPSIRTFSDAVQRRRRCS